MEITGINIAIGGGGKLIRVQFLLVFNTTLPTSVVCCKIFCGGLRLSCDAWPILMSLVSFRRTLNGLPDEINLLWHCSSPLRFP